jgi:TonB family protein
MGRAVALLALIGLCAGCGSGLASKENTDLLGEFDDIVEYDTPPVMVNAVRPEYPEMAREMGAEGKVVLKALIREDGKVGAVEIMESENPLLLDQAITALRQSTFVPATKDGEPCCATMVVPFIFNKEQTGIGSRTGLEVDRSSAPPEGEILPVEPPSSADEAIRPTK